MVNLQLDVVAAACGAVVYIIGTLILTPGQSGLEADWQLDYGFPHMQINKWSGAPKDLNRNRFMNFLDVWKYGKIGYLV